MMRDLRFAATAALSIALLGGCASGGTGSHAAYSGISTPAPATSVTIQPAGAPIDPGRQLSSAQQLQTDIQAVEAAATERALQNATAPLQQDYQAVVGSQATASVADWQQALTSLQQALADVRQLAAANSSAPDAPSPLKSGSSGGGTQSPSDIVSELKDAYDLLSNVVKDLGYTIVVHNSRNQSGIVNIATRLPEGPYPGIHCGQSEDDCIGVVLALSTVHVQVTSSHDGIVYAIDKIDSTDSACNPSYVLYTSGPAAGRPEVANCDVTATSGQTITITPQWERH